MSEPTTAPQICRVCEKEPATTTHGGVLLCDGCYRWVMEPPKEQKT